MRFDGDDDAVSAMEQVGEWVRFADAKAGVIAAAAAGALALVAAHASEVANAASSGRWVAAITTVLVLGVIGFSLATFWCVIQAVAPRPQRVEPTPNRFAWPALAAMTLDELSEHLSKSDRTAEAWRQAKNLSDIAAAKYKWCRRAMVSWLGLIVLVIMLVSSTAIVSMQEVSPNASTSVSR